MKRNILAIMLSVACIAGMQSCGKEVQSQGDGEATVTVELLGSELEDQQVGVSQKVADALPSTSSKMSGSASSGTTNLAAEEGGEQTKIISLENDVTLIATLTPRSNGTSASASTSTKSTVSSGAKASAAGNKAAIVRTPLGAGVKYRILVYQGDTFVERKDYEAGKSPEGFRSLKVGTTYTFVAYSNNSNTTLPTVTNESQLSNLRLQSSEDLMFFKTSLTVKEGDNFLGVILKHQFSQITMTTRLTDDTRGEMVSLTNVRFTGRGNAAASPHKSGTLRVNTGVLSYSTDTTSVPIAFPTLGAGLRTVTAAPTLLISNQINNVDIVIGNLLINAVINNKQVSTVRNNLVLEDFVIAPYQKYDLVLQIKNPCTEPTGDDTFQWRSQGGTVKTNTLYASGANYGYTFDIYELDNSFNMTINGQQLATKEIQFEYTSDRNLPQRNVRFADGSIWGDGNVQQIWTIIGNRDYPSVKLVISAKGEISLFGRKNNSDRTLYPIVFTDDTKFNKINWNTSSQNTVVVTQSVINITVMHGRGYGVKVIPCP